MEWIHDEYSVVGKHRLCADASAGEIWYCLDMWRTGADREYSSYTDCGRDHRGHSSYSDCGRDRRSCIPVTQIVEEDHRGEYSSSTECGRDRRGEQILE